MVKIISKKVKLEVEFEDEERKVVIDALNNYHGEGQTIAARLYSALK